MGHSIAAKYAARPAARFVRPSSRARERRLGLGASMGFAAAARRQTELRRADLAPLAAIRSRRGLTPTHPAASGGRLRPAVTLRWTASGRIGSAPRARADAAPWPG